MVKEKRMLQHLIRLIGRYKIILTMYLIVIWFSRIIPDNFLQPLVPNFVFVSKITDWKHRKNTKSQVTNVPRGFIWNGNNSKIRHSNVCNKCENGGLKNVDILSKVISLQCSCIKWLYDNSSHHVLFNWYLSREKF